jgi:hypothetical protein
MGHLRLPRAKAQRVGDSARAQLKRAALHDEDIPRIA